MDMHRLSRMIGAPVLGVALLGLAAVGAISEPVSVAAHEEGTPTAAELACTAPALPEGELTPPDATPAPAPELPRETPVPAGVAADEATAARVIAAAENFLGCYKGDDFEATVALMTPAAWLTEYLVTNPWDLVDQLPLLAQPYAVESLSDAQAHVDGSLSVDVVYVEDAHQVMHERWYFVPEGDVLLLNGREEMAVE